MKRKLTHAKKIENALSAVEIRKRLMEIANKKTVLTRTVFFCFRIVRLRLKSRPRGKNHA
ncbi:hypothetical protein EBA29_03296 [Bacillus velezensis]|nr:hypothetical protein EBA29_03296 [Bacillus velezensis]